MKPPMTTSRGLIVTFDLDSTLADTSPRRHLLPQSDPPDWTAYSMACAGDEPFDSAIRLAHLLGRYYDIAILSGRAEGARVPTERWLDRAGIKPVFMLLDDVGWTESHADYKVRRMEEILAAGWRVALHVDDQKSTKIIETKLGVPTVIITPDYSDGTEALL